MGAGCSSCGLHPLLQDEAAKRVNSSDNSSDVPNAATSSSFDSNETDSMAAQSVGTSTSDGAASWCPAGSAEFRSPAEVARAAKLALRTGGRRSGSSWPLLRMSLENAEADGGMVWVPLPGTPSANQPAQESCSTPSLCSLSTQSGSTAVTSGALQSGSLQTGSIGSTAASSGGLASGSIGSVDTLSSSARVSSAAASSSLANDSSISWPARAQARDALQATLQQLVKLPFREFLRAGPPKMGPNGTPMDIGDSNFGFLGRNPPPAVEELLTAAVRGAGVDTAILTVDATRRVWVRNNAGFRPGTFPWCWSAWQSRAPQPQLLVVPDTLAVPRLADALHRQPPPRIRFFAGIPLLGPEGLVLGSLCLVGREPQQPTDEQCSAFTELAERVAAELAKDTARLQLLQGRPSTTISLGDVKPMESAAINKMRQRAVLFVDAAQQPWAVLHANTVLAEVAGVEADAAAGQPLWRLFTRPFPEDSPAWEAAVEVAARGDEFILRCCRVADAPERGTFSLQFRPADQGGLDDDTELADLPAQLPSAPGDAGHPYFVVVTPETAPAGDGGYTPVQALNLSRERPLTTALVEGLELGPLLARGSFGSVFRGRFRGKKVAVKVCTGNMRSMQGKTLKPWKNMEAMQVRNLRHPNIVAALKHATVINQGGDLATSSWSNSSGERSRPRSSARDSATAGTAGTTSSPGTAESGAATGNKTQSEHTSSGRCSTAASWSEDESSDTDECSPKCSAEMETWLVMEYCNRGTLRSGIERGYFSSRPQRCARADTAQHNTAKLDVVLAVAAEIASAMAYLLSRNVVHGDLCGSNVMLTTDNGKPAGFTSKIADFGLSRQLKAQSVCTATYGTVTHMPPELMLEQRLTTASDVFSFGILLWEMANGAQAWEGMSYTQVVAKVAMEDERPPWPAHAPPAIKDLSVRCTASNPGARPTFPAIQEELAALQAGLRQQSAN